MDTTKKDEKKPEGQESTFQQRVEIQRLILDTPTLLNMIKHCQDTRQMIGLTSSQLVSQQNQSASNEGIAQGARGLIMGVLKKELEQHYLIVNSSTPMIPKTPTLSDLRQAQSSDLSNNEIGFYVSCQLGLAFSHKNLIQLIASYRNFRNSLMIVYDVSKSTYGLNPLKAYRLSQLAINALKLNDQQTLTSQLVQDKIRENNLEMSTFFEEINIKINRTHLVQAFLFDHIQPHMPAYNTNIFRMGTQTQHMTQYLFQSGEQANIALEEMKNIEKQQRDLIKHAKKANKKQRDLMMSNKQDGKVEEKPTEFKVDDSTNNKMDLFLFGQQLDQLCTQINEFETCFPEQAAPQTATE